VFYPCFFVAQRQAAITHYQQDVTFWSGDHKDLIYTVTNASTGASVNLTGASGYWVLSNGPTSGSILRLTSDSGSGITVSGCTLTVSLSPAHTTNLAGQYYSEAQIRDSASNVSTVAVGTVTINYDVAGV
jgi:hypothetical protein